MMRRSLPMAVTLIALFGLILVSVAWAQGDICAIEVYDLLQFEEVEDEQPVVEFLDLHLKLNVTPRITPDNKITMDLVVDAIDAAGSKTGSKIRSLVGYSSYPGRNPADLKRVLPARTRSRRRARIPPPPDGKTYLSIPMTPKGSNRARAVLISARITAEINRLNCPEGSSGVRLHGLDSTVSAFAGAQFTQLASSIRSLAALVKLKSGPTLAASLVHLGTAEPMQILLNGGAFSGADPVKGAKMRLLVQVLDGHALEIYSKKVNLKTKADGTRTKSLQLPALDPALGQPALVVVTATGRGNKLVSQWGTGLAFPDP